jgi:hypothetical protein
MSVTPQSVAGNVSFTFDGAVVGGANGLKLTNGPTLVEVSELGNGFVGRFPTIKDFSLNFDLTYDPADAGQVKLIAAHYTPVAKAVVISLPGGHSLTGTVYVESFGYSFDSKDVVKVSVSLKGTSLLVYA